ncbi:hypothetical protein IFM89_028263 [Coptis chinensis]|uniref:Uncharacterized protein n=1 Tax=Coptis chinensis TaxID=261450 RepID=A0A835HHS7_9MAGN|nr:hypothetical protein IFM89_028263 [Coptis chinensis]
MSGTTQLILQESANDMVKNTVRRANPSPIRSSNRVILGNWNCKTRANRENEKASKRETDKKLKVKGIWSPIASMIIIYNVSLNVMLRDQMVLFPSRSQRSKECPICWQLLVLKDPTSQELLATVGIERNARGRRTSSSSSAFARIPSKDSDSYDVSYAEDFGLQ